MYRYTICIPTTSTPDLSYTKRQVTDAVMTASRVLVSVAARSLADHEEEVSLQQYRALVVLASRGPQRPGDLAVALGVDPSTATRLCDRLVRKQLISRRRAGSDRREVRLDLTRTGNRLVDNVTQRRREEIEQLLRAVPISERGNLVRAFEAFGRAAGEVPDGEWQRSWDL